MNIFLGYPDKTAVSQIENRHATTGGIWTDNMEQLVWTSTSKTTSGETWSVQGDQESYVLTRNGSTWALKVVKEMMDVMTGDEKTLTFTGAVTSPVDSTELDITVSADGTTWDYIMTWSPS